MTKLPRSGSLQAEDSLLEGADLAEAVRLYGMRNWVKQSYRHLRDELDWADFMERVDMVTHPHWYQAWCIFSFC
ncbi:MAG: hypothetical protein ACYC66_04710 [Chloroflexota bacterium]